MPFTAQTYERNRLLSRLLVVTIIAAIVHAVWDTFTAGLLVGVFDLFLVAVLLVFLLLNRKGYYAIARYGTVIFTILVVLVYSSLVPRGIGVSLLFFPIVSLAFVVFEYKQKEGRWLVAFLVILGYLALELSEYKLLGPNLTLVEEEDRVSYIVNFITCLILIYFAFDFLIRAHFKAEQHLRHMSTEMEKQNTELSKANHELDRFVYSTSHDLKAPLRSVLGLLNLIEQQPTEEERNMYLGMIRNRITNLDKFIADITLYSRNMRLEVERQSLNLYQLAQEVIENHRYIDVAAPITFYLHIPKQLSLLSDKTRVTTILNNLVSNAIKYHDIYQKNPWVKINAKQEGEKVILEVEDNGPGMPTSVKEKIFTMFYRGNERSEGSGLGLYIVQEVVEKLAGTITVTSAPGKGSTFTVILPNNPAE